MNDLNREIDKLLVSLQERAKELNCLYDVERILSQFDLPLVTAFQRVVDAMPPGWQYPEVCVAMLDYGEAVFKTSEREFRLTPWVQAADISIQGEIVGRLSVWYMEERPHEVNGPFLEEEERLINTIAERLSHFILFHELQEIRSDWENVNRKLEATRENRWRGPIELLRRTDRDLFMRTGRKMINHLCWTGVEGAQELLHRVYGVSDNEESLSAEVNVPAAHRGFDQSILLSGAPFELAVRSFGEEQTLSLLQAWIMEEKASFLPKVVNNPRTPPAEVADAIRRFQLLEEDGAELSFASINGIRVSLIRRFLTEQLDFITVAKRHLEIGDFTDLLDRFVISTTSNGKVGGKSAGIILAEKILRKCGSEDQPVGDVKIPRSWYVASEGLNRFIEYNDLEEVMQQKYKEIPAIRHEYPNLIQVFKKSRFPPEIAKGLSMALDEIGEKPLIVRSSSLLEDRFGAAFCGKYKSLFLPNQGSKAVRMEALLDAISEVYASVFGPDPIAYRRERDLLDFHEEMGILLQEVVGRKVGDYFLPALGGVAFSNNEFRWSPRIKREDGLIRLVPGLGTRAVDRVADDYPILVVPGQPNLKVNTTVDEAVRYSPKKIDVINLRTNSFETVDIEDFLGRCGVDFPAFEKVFSVLKDDLLSKPVRMLTDTKRDELVADFGGLVSGTDFVKHIGTILKTLQANLGTPVDIEFAFDGDDFFLLQCRPQGYAEEDAPMPIPRDIDAKDVVFSANRFVSNGWIPDITHIVYVDPAAYSRLEKRSDLFAVGTLIGALNKMLPKRQFVLMGPGRWGSRGDIKLGVGVSYSDINNTAMLIEIARSTGGFVPDLSFGTHFFQDLVEAGIRYLPLYPDEEGVIFNEIFLARASNLLAEMLPEFAWLEDTVRVIDIPGSTQGSIMRVLMNAELGEAVAMLVAPESTVPSPSTTTSITSPKQADDYWKWRLQMAERIASEIDPKRFGVHKIYVFGSTKNASAGPGSDIDLLIHIRGDEKQRRDLAVWLEGWNLCLTEINYLRTGYQCETLLDVHYVTDLDIENRTSYAVKIGAVTDAARELPLGRGGS